MIEVGAFKYDPEAKSLAGPADYMRERGDAKLEEILAGKSAVVNAGFSVAAEGKHATETLVLVALQTDYAGWLGLKRLAGMGS